jgi:hypothetical protein
VSGSQSEVELGCISSINAMSTTVTKHASERLESDFEYLWNRRCAIQLRALTNRMYAQERQRIFELREGMVKAIAILAGSIAFGRIADQETIQWCAVAITFTSAASLVFGFGSKARDSAKRNVEWSHLERDLEAAGERHFTEEQINLWAARCNEIEAGEPSPHPGLLERSYLRACESLGSQPSKKRSILTRLRPAIIIH